MSSRIASVAFIILIAVSESSADTIRGDESPAAWYEYGESELAQALKLQAVTGRAKNIVLFIGDGMGVSTVTAARILEGQQRGQSGEENWLSFEKLPYVGLAKVYNTNQQTPDSAGTMTAIMTGVKTKSGVIGVNGDVIRGSCESASGKELVSLLEQWEADGRASGIVTTTSVTHATPAATYAKSPDRNWESPGAMPPWARKGGCRDIADQLVQFSAGDGLDVVLGGGRRHFLPQVSDHEDVHAVQGGGVRTDSRNLIDEWRARYPKGVYVSNRRELLELNAADVDRVLGLFNHGHLAFELDRRSRDIAEPSLAEMTAFAIDSLSQNERGFFLMIEAGRIDHAHHATSPQRALEDTIALHRAVEVALAKTDRNDTLTIVTADHSHVFTMAGYPTRGNPILGKVVGNDGDGRPRETPSLALDKRPYATLGYTNGRPTKHGHRFMDGDTDTYDPDFRSEVLIPLSAETHSGEDVAVYADGPWAHLIHKTHEQNYLYHVMRHAAGL